MKQILIATAFLGAIVSLAPTEASALVCARGVVRAGCVTAGGAAVVRRQAVARRPAVVAPRAVVVAPPGVAVRRRVIR